MTGDLSSFNQQMGVTMMHNKVNYSRHEIRFGGVWMEATGLLDRFFTESRA